MKIYDNKDINIEELNIEVLKELCNCFMQLEDCRNSSYDIHFLHEIVMIVFWGLMANCDEWTTIYMFAEMHYDWLKIGITI